MATLEKMAGHTRLYRRGAVYYHRAAVPKDIVDSYGKSEETFSLKTKDHKEAVRLVRIEAVRVDGLFEEHRKRLAQPPASDITPSEADQLYHTYYSRLLDQDDEIRSSGALGRQSDVMFEDIVNSYNADAEQTKRDLGRGKIDSFPIEEVEDTLEEAGLKLKQGGAGWSKAVIAMQKAHIAASEALARRFEGEIVETPRTPQRAAQEPSSTPLLSVIFRQRRDEATLTNSWSEKLRADHEKWLALFIELCGDRPISTYRKSDARSFKECLIKLPTNRNKHAQTKGLPALEACEVALRDQMETMSVATINKGLNRLQSTWTWATGQLDAHIVNIFDGLKLRQTTSAMEQTDPFSAEQLRSIFDSPIYSGCKSERERSENGLTDMSHTSWYWLPLLGLWTGARLNELCQLRLEDIGEEAGVNYIHIRPKADDQRTKNSKSRIVPLHPELIRLGFLRYAETLHKAGEERVFPKLTRGSSGYYSDQSSKDFSAYLKKLGIKTDKTSFHSFRHNVKDACRHAEIPSDTNDILLGHSLTGMAGRYGDGRLPISLLHDAVCKIRFDGLSLAHIKGFKG